MLKVKNAFLLPCQVKNLGEIREKTCEEHDPQPAVRRVCIAQHLL